MLKEFLQVNNVSLECFILTHKLSKLIDLVLQSCKSVNLLLNEVGDTIENFETLLSVGGLLSDEFMGLKIIDCGNNGSLVSTSPRNSVFFFLEVMLRLKIVSLIINFCPFSLEPGSVSCVFNFHNLFYS